MTTETADNQTAAQRAASCPACGAVDGDHELQQQLLDCPDCLDREGIHSKMGNKRSQCKRCNRFAQRLIRSAARRLQDEHEEHYEALREEAEVELYLSDVGEDVA